MDRKDLLNTIETHIARLGLYYSREASAWVASLTDDELVIIIRLLNKLNKYFSKKR